MVSKEASFARFKIAEDFFPNDVLNRGRFKFNLAFTVTTVGRPNIYSGACLFGFQIDDKKGKVLYQMQSSAVFSASK